MTLAQEDLRVVDGNRTFRPALSVMVLFVVYLCRRLQVYIPLYLKYFHFEVYTALILEGRESVYFLGEQARHLGLEGIQI